MFNGGIIKKWFFKKISLSLIEKLNFIRTKFNILICAKKWNKNQTYTHLYKSNSMIVANYLNKSMKENYSKLEMIGIMSLLDVLGNNEITEENILKIKGYNAFPSNWHMFRNFRTWIFSKLKKENKV